MYKPASNLGVIDIFISCAFSRPVLMTHTRDTVVPLPVAIELRSLMPLCLFLLVTHHISDRIRNPYYMAGNLWMPCVCGQQWTLYTQVFPD
jgi:hypothetical protein